MEEEFRDRSCGRWRKTRGRWRGDLGQMKEGTWDRWQRDPRAELGVDGRDVGRTWSREAAKKGTSPGFRREMNPIRLQGTARP